MLYRIPRSQVTAGVRALGRLAFVDHYRTIVKRLRTELDGCLNPNALALAGRQTQLGVRSNRPRVYVVASLAGGTGSGMFLDLTYTVRTLLKQIGYEQPEVVGLLFLPPTEGKRTRKAVAGQHLCGPHRDHFLLLAGQFVRRPVSRTRTADPRSRPAVQPLFPAADGRGSRHRQEPGNARIWPVNSCTAT